MEEKIINQIIEKGPIEYDEFIKQLITDNTLKNYNEEKYKKAIDKLIDKNIILKNHELIKYNTSLNDGFNIVKNYLEYINRNIKSEELINNFIKYGVETKHIDNLNEICSKYKVELDEREKRNIKSRDKIENRLEELLLKMKEDTLKNEETINQLEKTLDNINESKKIVRDSGPLYKEIVKYMNESDLIKIPFEAMPDNIMLDLLTSKISFDYVFNIRQEFFDELVKLAMSKKSVAKEYLWRLSNTFYPRKLDMSEIIDYYILCKDSYYLGELFSFSNYYVDRNNLAIKILETRDKNFINDCVNYFKNLDLIDDEEIKKYKKIYEEKYN